MSYLLVGMYGAKGTPEFLRPTGEWTRRFWLVFDPIWVSFLGYDYFVILNKQTNIAVFVKKVRKK
jgi:hypothetical protein